MSYFTNPNARHRLSLTEYDGSDNWVEIPERLPRHARLALGGAILDFEVGPNGTARMQSQADILSARFEETLIRTVLAWSFTDDQGAPVAITREAVRLLEDSLGEWLYDAINAYYAQKRQERQAGQSDADFTGRALPIIEANARPRSAPSPSSSLSGSVTATPIALGS